jgi:GAF domain-containing protein
MSTPQPPLDPRFNSVFSFKPLIRAWETIIKDAREGSGQLYADLLQKVKAHPELLEPITDDALFEKHATLIDQMMTTVFPVTLSDKQDLYAVSLPFQYKVIYGSSLFKQMFIGQDGTYINVPDATAESLYKQKAGGAYQLILDRLYHVRVDGTITSVHPYQCPDSGLQRFMELELDTRFIDVIPTIPLPELSTEFCNCCTRITDLERSEVCDTLQLKDFRFEGLVIVRIKDVTEREVINKIKNSLLSIHSFADLDVFKELQVQIRNLLGVDGVHTAVKPFFRVNNHLVLSEMLTSSGTAKPDKLITQEKKVEIYKQIVAAFKAQPRILRITSLDEEAMFRYPFVTMLHERGFRSAIICPLFNEEKELLGVLILASFQPGTLTAEHVARIEHAVPLFVLALQKSQEHLDHQVDKVIKEQFTAVQDAVEWRFTEAALNYLTNKGQGLQTKIEPIYFENVFPLYGAIDIRNSSVERNNAIQLDMLEQLAMAYRIVEHAKTLSSFPLLDEIHFRLERYTHAVTNILFAEEELAIHHFLVDEMVQLFKHLQLIMPDLSAGIYEYMQAIDSPVKMVYHHRKDYEESITRINNEVAKLIDHEQRAAQEIYPHYFERFVTDGLDFNIYIGQSISPERPFDSFYLKNLKIWQLTTLVKAAQLTHQLQAELPLQLQTTQLILAHSQPISISFRTAERKFDVDGAYNIRYEIIKKRIDKVHIRDTHERLTKPGTISIVYSQPKEAEEYTAYIEYLQGKGLLKEEIERYDLEELQGVIGLRGLRVTVNTDVNTPEPEPEIMTASLKTQAASQLSSTVE